CRRIVALKRNAGQAVILISGAAGMFFIAALIEAFWSPLVLPAGIKFAIGAFLWVLVFSYLFFTGRKRHEA
ncbi:MAG: stage II sporulation protein M, partial [Chromatiales bacterium]